MPIYANQELNLEVYSLDNARWEDFETLLGDRGGCGGCWCMSWRLKKSNFEKQKGTENKVAMRSLVDNNERVEILAYIDGIPIGWLPLHGQVSPMFLKEQDLS